MQDKYYVHTNQQFSEAMRLRGYDAVRRRVPEPEQPQKRYIGIRLKVTDPDMTEEAIARMESIALINYKIRK